jgi:hypothetical protein
MRYPTHVLQYSKYHGERHAEDGVEQEYARALMSTAIDEVWIVFEVIGDVSGCMF